MRRPTLVQQHNFRQHLHLPSGAVAGLFLFNVVLFAVVFFAVGELMPIMLAASFNVIFIGGIAAAMHRAEVTDFYNSILLNIDEPPAAGGWLSASLELPEHMLPDKVRARFACSNVVEDAFGRRKVEEIVALELPSRQVRQMRREEGRVILIDLEIPAALPPSSPKPRGRREPGTPFVEWELKVYLQLANHTERLDFRIEVQPPRQGVRPAARPTGQVYEPPQGDAGDARSLFALVAFNCVPLVGVAAFGWRVQDLLLLYWVEAMLVGVFNVLRIAKTGPQRGTGAIIAMFSIQFGIVMLAQGSLLAELIHQELSLRGTGIAGALYRSLGNTLGVLTVLAMVLGYAYNYVHDFIGRKAYLRADMLMLMFWPYKRILVTQVFLILGGWVLLQTNAGLAATMVFVVVKTGFDGWFLRREQRTDEH